jgi:hypothetical protein
MAAARNKMSLSADGPKPTDAKPRRVEEYHGLSHPPHQEAKYSSARPTVERLSIQVEDNMDGFVSGFLHLPPKFAKGVSIAPNQTAAILLSGAGGGVVGPSSMYLSMGDKLASTALGIPTLRLDYRYPARNRYCVEDVKASMRLLEDIYELHRFVLVGWSFGGAPVFTVGGEDERVTGCATVASQTAETYGIQHLAPRPLLLLHGLKDRTLSPKCSRDLYSMYGSNGSRTLKLFEGDDHALTRHASEAEELLCNFIANCAGLRIGDGEKEAIEKILVHEDDRLKLMRQSGDLRTPESID